MTEQTDTAHRRAGRRLGAALLRGVEVAVGTAATARAFLWDLPMFALYWHATEGTGMFGWFRRGPKSEKPRRRKVFLLDVYGDTCLRDAYPSDSGWYAYRHVSGSIADTPVVLLPGGKVVGPSYVASWLPHSGWDGTSGIPDVGEVRR